jgi:hypothetical protein
MGCQGSHIPKTLSQNMAVRLSALRTVRALTPERFLVLIPVRGSVIPKATARLERLDELKKRITLSGNEPRPFGL